MRSSTARRGRQTIADRFTADVGRPGLAREARDAVRAALVAQNPLRKAPISEPVDYEKFINERRIQLKNDAQMEIVLFPRDDIEESSTQQECKTAIPMVKPNDIKSSAAIENETLSSLVFESEMALEDERAAYGASMGNGAIGVVKEGHLNVIKSDTTLFDNLKSSTSKKRYCVLRRLEGGECTFEIRKTATEVPKIPPLKVSTAQIKSTKKGKTVLEIRSFYNECLNEFWPPCGQRMMEPMRIR